MTDAPAIYVWRSTSSHGNLGFAQEQNHKDFQNKDWEPIGELEASGLPNFVIEQVKKWTYNGWARTGHIDSKGSFIT